MLMAGASPEVPASKHFSPEQQTRALLATVRVANGADRTEGAGVMIHQKDGIVHVLTAAHLVGRAETVEVGLFTSKSYPKPAQVIPRATVVARAAGADLALLRFDYGTLVGVTPLCPRKAIPKNQEFPALLVGLMQGAPVVGEDTVRRKLVRKPNATAAVPMWETSEPSPKGRSGGPLLDSQGHVLGVCSGTGDGKGYYVHIDDIHTFLGDNGCRWLFEEKDR